MTKSNVSGKILIASPSVTDAVFNHSVVFIHTDSDVGAIGIILNAPMRDDVAIQWSKEVGWEFPNRIRHGGPAEHQLGYIIHSNDYASGSSIKLNEDISYTSGTAIIKDIGRGIGPSEFLLLSGYCAWRPGQLKQEIINEKWIESDFDLDYFFLDSDRIATWEIAIHLAAQLKTEILLDTV